MTTDDLALTKAIALAHPGTSPKITFDELVETIPALRAEVDWLRARLARTAAECAYCGKVFAADDPAQADHWRNCPDHPARAELEQLRDKLRWTALELDRCREQARLYHNALVEAQAREIA